MKYLLVLVAGCSFSAAGAPSPDGAAGADGPEVCHTFSTQLDTCALGTPTNDLTLSGSNTYDTDTGLLNGLDAPHMGFNGQAGPIDALIARDVHFTLGAALRATGSKPLAIIAVGSITLDGNTLIDVANGGAGARTDCPNGAGSGEDNGGGAGGGGGGGFGAMGGRGGDGNSDGTQSMGGSAGSAADQPPGPLGGCPGGHGGFGDHAGGEGGLGGGALLLAAKVSITLATSAVVDAGGGGGGGGDAGGTFNNGDAGGGGGGAGGMLMLESPMIRAAGALVANGGGGGEGGDNNDTGTFGADGHVTDTNAAQGGGGAANNGGGGGDGANGTT
ncbi:MAG TPA: hypothetical protein VLT45_06575, partial [Kofleriaceae bacterium]|nr:hypothetical protein [Kofleriaceae bacterium]